MVKIFVYGTLMRGQENAHMMSAAEFSGEAVTQHAAYDLIAVDYPAYPYPALITGNRFIKGEVYNIDPKYLMVLDIFEGVEYERREIALEGGELADTYYLRDGQNPPKIEKLQKLHYDPGTNTVQWK